MDKIRAPYNFVPLSPEVYFPDWADVATHDVPFEDGICGVLPFEIVAESPIFVRGADGQPPDEFFRLPDGTHAIPGTSIRGMLRNVLEIATYGKLGRFNDHRYGVRDLHNRTLYGDHMARIQNRRPVPLVTAGWLERRGDPDDEDNETPAEITPCDFAKLEYGMLIEEATRRGNPTFDPGRKQSASEKYRSWRGTRQILAQTEMFRPAGSDTSYLGDFGRVTRLGQGRTGTLVFTGQPSQWRRNRVGGKPSGAGNPKHHDFVFFDRPEARPLPVSQRVYRDFTFIHSDRGQQGRATSRPNVEWEYWRRAFVNGERVPIFFLLDPEKAPRERVLWSFGLAMMFRLAYRLSIGDAVSNAQPDFGDPRLDFVETLFGHEGSGRSDGDRQRAPLKGRISIGAARLQGSPNVVTRPIRAVLGAPKASYYPNYILQSPNTSAYVTLMDRNARVRGWKRYRPQSAQMNPRLPQGASDSVITAFSPLREGSRFRGNLRVHNVRPVELGALLWALDFGGADNCFHMLGMARSIGFGRVRFKLAADAATRCTNMEGRGVDLDACRAAFVAEMTRFAKEKQIPGEWQRSESIDHLLANARPIPEGSDDGRHMRLDHSQWRNEFVTAKKEGLALEPLAPLRPPPRRPAQAARPSGGGAPTTSLGAKLAAASTAKRSPEAQADHDRLTTAVRSNQAGAIASVLREWMNEAGVRELERKRIAREIVTFRSKALKRDHADVIAWIDSNYR
jgi:CRISPR-associated protein (TIGR03986 family)